MEIPKKGEFPSQILLTKQTPRDSTSIRMASLALSNSMIYTTQMACMQEELILQYNRGNSQSMY